VMRPKNVPIPSGVFKSSPAAVTFSSTGAADPAATRVERSA